MKESLTDTKMAAMMAVEKVDQRVDMKDWK